MQQGGCFGRWFLDIIASGFGDGIVSRISMFTLPALKVDDLVIVSVYSLFLVMTIQTFRRAATHHPHNTAAFGVYDCSEGHLQRAPS